MNCISGFQKVITCTVFQKITDHCPETCFVPIIIFIRMLTAFEDQNQLFLSIHSSTLAFFLSTCSLSLFRLYTSFRYRSFFQISSIITSSCSSPVPALAPCSACGIFPPSNTFGVFPSSSICDISPSTYPI